MTFRFRRVGLVVTAAAIAMAAISVLAYRPIRKAFHGTAFETELRRVKYRLQDLGRTSAKCESTDAAAPAPNVVLIALDTLRADHLGMYGYSRPVSPALDALARDSVVFSSAIAPAPWTLPSFAGVLTGFHPAALGILNEPKPLPPEATTLGEALCERGFQTAGVISHLFVGSTYSFDRGFERWDQSNVGGHAYVSSAKVTDKATAFLDEFEDDRPFFLFTHYFDAHYDYMEHAEFPYSKEGASAVRSQGNNIVELQRLASSGQLDEESRNYLVDCYDSEIAFMDQQIGRLIDHLKATDRYDDTLIVVVADHGEMFAEREDRWIGHTRYVYDSLVRVPLLLKLPQSRITRTVTAAVSTVDVRATVLEAVGDPSADPRRTLLRSLTQPAEPVFSQTRRGAKLDTVVHEGWKLIREYETGELELYNIAQDPEEKQNLVESNGAVAARLEPLIVDWLEEIDFQPQRFTRTTSPVLSEGEVQRLKSLGYAD